MANTLSFIRKMLRIHMNIAELQLIKTNSIKRHEIRNGQVAASQAAVQAQV